MRSVGGFLALTVWLSLFPGIALAQTAAGSIAGTVRDTTGAVLPGVTVEASSPALIEKVRSVVTGDGGQYRIVDLRPGTYTVTFTLPGFGTVRREGIGLTSEFTATVNADLRVGEVSETITVTGDAPLVDVQNTQRQVVMTREIIDTLPTARMYTSVGVLIPGITLMNTRSPGNSSQEVGGTGGIKGANNTGLVIHGGRLLDQQTHIDGMPVISAGSSSQAPTMLYADVNFQEIVLDVAANAPQIEAGGVRVNMIPREGGNTFKGTSFFTFGSPSLQADNMTDALRQQGLADPNRVKSIWQYSASLGGPIMKDRLWFFGGHTQQLNENYVAGQYVNTNLMAWDYVPDSTKQAFDLSKGYDFAVRGTWQATPRNKITVYYDFNHICLCTQNLGAQTGSGGLTSTITTLDASDFYLRNTNIMQVAWTAPVTSRLLFEAGFSRSDFFTDTKGQPNAGAPRITDTGLGVIYRNNSNNFDKIANPITNAARGSVAYVTGSHSVKVGASALVGWNDQNAGLDRTGKTLSMEFRTLNGVPNQVTFFGGPIYTTDYQKPASGIYAQDQWTRGRLTMNLGGRYDYFRASFPDHAVEPTRWVPIARFVPGMVAVSWHDFSPRLGLAYDLFGNAKTALKVSANRYVLSQNSGRAGSLNPIAQNNSSARRWTDNGDHIVQGDAFNPLANGELGPSPNLNFGKPNSTLQYDPDWAFGFGKRAYNWEFSAGLQHELVPNISVGAAYFRRIYGNFEARFNQALTPADFDTYCVTTPVDARLPGGGGKQICGLYDLNASKVGQQQNVVTSASDFGDVMEHWNGVDFTVQARLLKVLFQGGVSIGKSTADVCAIAKSHPEVVVSAGPLASDPSTPASECHYEAPFGAQTQVKLAGTYTMPWDVQVAATFQHLPGSETLASATYTSAQIAPSLGRQLAAASTLNIPIVASGTVYGDRLSQFDLRIGKTFKVAGAQLRGSVDMYNLFNGNVVTNRAQAYGATTGTATGAAWLRPISILEARLIKLSVQADF